jgi:PKD repeat protein
MGSYGGTFDLITNVLTGYTTQTDGSYLKTSGSFDSGTGKNDASVWFSISDNYGSPTANAGTDKTAFKGEQVNFDCSLSSASSGSSIESYQWDFENDGTWDATTVLTSHTYTSKGTFTAKLKITDSIGQTSLDTCSVTINTKNPIAVFSWTPTSPSTSDTVTFTDSSSDPDGVIVSWSWNFGDGQTANVKNPTHKFTNAGSYSVQLTVTDDDGATNTKTSSITISTSQSSNNNNNNPPVDDNNNNNNPTGTDNDMLVLGLIIVVLIVIIGGIGGFLLLRKKAPQHPTQWMPPQGQSPPPPPQQPQAPPPGS